MGLFGPFEYKTKSKQKFYLHMKIRGKAKLFYFSKEPVEALSGIPAGYEVVENPKTSLPFLKKKIPMGLFGPKKQPQQEKPKAEEKTSAPAQQ